MDVMAGVGERATRSQLVILPERVALATRSLLSRARA
jgi:hypothetical protein